MKKKYYKPVISISMFCREDIVTGSIVNGQTAENKAMEALENKANESGKNLLGAISINW